jgi:ACDE family multidrug resistance protein
MGAMSVQNKAALSVILVSATLTVMSGAIIAPVLNLMTEGLGVDPSRARVLITTHSIFIALASPLYGIVIDKIGPKKPLIFGLMLYGVSGVIGLLSNEYWLVYASRAILGIGAAAIFTSLTILIFDLYREGEERNRLMGWRASSQSGGGVIWPLLGGFLGTLSWHYPFAVYFIGIPLGVLVWLYVPQTRNASSGGGAGHGKSVFRIFRENPMLFAIYGLVFLSSLFLYGIVVFLPQVLDDLGMTSSLSVGLYISGMGLMAGIVGFGYAKLRARLTYKPIVVIALGLWAIGFFLLSRATNGVMVGFAVTVFGAGQGMIMPTAQLWTGELVASSIRGRITSYLGSFGLGGQFLSPIILSPVEASFGRPTMFLTITVTSLIVGTMFLLLMKQPAKVGPSGTR